MKNKLLLIGVIVYLFIAGEPFNVYAQKNESIFWDSTTLAKIKSRIDSDKYINLSLKKLKKTCDKIVSEKIVSVVDKKEIPPSGDIHDYIDFSPYYWPDTSKPGGLPYIVKDGEVNPETDTLGDKISFMRMPIYFRNLVLCFYYTDDLKYAGKAIKYLRTWFVDEKTKMNTHLIYSQTVRGKNTVDGHPTAAGKNLIFLFDGIYYLEEKGLLPESDITVIKKWFHDYLAWLLNSETGEKEANIKGVANLGTWYDVQVFAIAKFLDKKNICEQIIGNSSLRIEEQIADDGKQPFELKRTRALTYTMANLEAWMLFSEEIKNSEYVFDKNEKLKKALDYAMYLHDNFDKEGYKQIIKYNFNNSYIIYIIAFLKYGDVRYKEFILKNGGENCKSSIENLIYIWR